MFRLILVIGVIVSLYGCANSASHQVMKRERATDDMLTCSGIQTEKRKAQVIINGVEQDKEDMTGADFVDGLLWFPFNVIAKQANYSSATSAADARIEHLTMLEADMGCSGAYGATAARGDALASRKLLALNQLYKDGLLTKNEYMEKRKLVLDGVVYSGGKSVVQEGEGRILAPTSSVGRSIGVHEFQAQQFSSQQRCAKDVVFLQQRQGVDLYTAECANGDALVISCQWGKCRLMQ